MKKILVLLCIVVLTLACSGYGLAEATPEPDYEALLAEKDAQIAELQAQVDQLSAQLAQLLTTPEPVVATYTTLQKGSSGQEVSNLQQRLKDLGYLSGSADGSYGNQSAAAVSEFQTNAGLTATGIADEATQEALYAEDAPKSLSASYEDLDYDANARDPEAYTGTMVKFSGTVLQVMEDDDYVIFRIATDGGYDDVVYAVYPIPDNYKRFLEDDKVQVYGISTGVYTYETVMGSEVTIPACLVDSIALK